MISATVSLFLAPYLMKASCTCAASSRVGSRRSEEHTSELQSRSDLVCRLLLEKKKTKYISDPTFSTLETLDISASDWIRSGTTTIPLLVGALDGAILTPVGPPNRVETVPPSPC